MEYTIPVNGWKLGVDNVQPDVAVSDGALRGAVNVDVYDSGNIKRRRGYTRVVSVPNTHSLWSDPGISGGYYFSDGAIYYLAPDLVSTQIVNGLPITSEIAFIRVNSDVFWSNGINTGKIINKVNYPWGVETPANKPSLSAISGSLPPGTYQVSITFLLSTGEEGASTTPVPINLPVTGGIRLSGVPTPISPLITSVAVYLTAQNGDVLYLSTIAPAGTTSIDVVTTPQPKRVLRTQNLSPMPPGGVLAHRNGVVFSASGNVVWYSEPMRYGLCDRTKNFYVYPSNVSVMMAVPDGLYIVADKTYFLTNPGTPDVEQKIVLPFGAAKGTGVYLPNGTQVAWFSHRGQVLASEGDAKVITEERFSPAIISKGAALVREWQGLRQIITVPTQISGDSQLKSTGV